MLEEKAIYSVEKFIVARRLMYWQVYFHKTSLVAELILTKVLKRAKELTQKSLPEIGELFGGRDHTTVLHAVRKITEERSRDNQLNHELHVLQQSLKN